MSTRRSVRLKKPGETDVTSVAPSAQRIEGATTSSAIVKDGKTQAVQSPVVQVEVPTTVTVSAEVHHEGVSQSVASQLVDGSQTIIVSDAPPVGQPQSTIPGAQTVAVSSDAIQEAEVKNTTPIAQTPPAITVSTLKKAQASTPVQLTLKCEMAKSDAVTVTPVGAVKYVCIFSATNVLDIILFITVLTVEAWDL